jgi:hypothetical protein
MQGSSLQELIHKIEQGSWAKYLPRGLAVVAFVALIVTYNVRCFQNMKSPEAMDAAQLARNLSEGEGFTTSYIRPFSMHLIAKHETGQSGVWVNDAAQIKEVHPDIANPPLYPLVLAGIMKLVPAHQDIFNASAFWTQGRGFWWYQPDFTIGLFNQVIFFVCIFLLFRLARRLFPTDPWLAWISAGIFLGTEIFWRFSISGLSTMLAILIFLGMAWCLVVIDQRVREDDEHASSALWLAAIAGALVALAGLTRYSFAALIVPVLVFLGLFAGRRRVISIIAALAAFLLLFSPWVARNYSVSGTPFGTAGFAAMQETSAFSGDRLERSLTPELYQLTFRDYVHKVLNNTRDIVRDEIPTMGGTWVTALFLAGLMVGFRNPTLSRLRYFILMCLPVLVCFQALGRTAISHQTPVINGENLLVLIVPLVILYGVALFMTLLDQMRLPFPQMKYAVIILFGLVCCAPLIFALLPPRSSAVSYPPYMPPRIQQVSAWMKPDELLMSDVPWAVAWYGDRQCIDMTLNAQDDFFAINDYQKPVLGLYLTPETMDSRFLTEWVRAGEHSWGSFILQSAILKQVPRSFPLRKAPDGFWPEQMFLSDWERWASETN